MQNQCKKCGSPIFEGEQICPKCRDAGLKVLWMARTSRVLSILGIFTLFFSVGILITLTAVICGIIALIKIKKGEGIYKGKSAAIIGVILGLVMLVITTWDVLVVIPAVKSDSVRIAVSSIRTTQQETAVAVENYYVAHGSYPPPDYDTKGRPIVPHALTTPAAYLHSLPYDPYNHDGKGYYGYGVDTVKGYIIVSYGPDKVDGNSGVPDGSKMPYMKAWSDEALGFNLQASPLTYDPSNGIYSSGDIWRRGP